MFLQFILLKVKTGRLKLLKDIKVFGGRLLIYPIYCSNSAFLCVKLVRSCSVIFSLSLHLFVINV